jgi:Domain of unknown function (DUF4405)
MSSSTPALRRLSSVALAVSFAALTSSGLLMLAIDRLGFKLRMHPVHEVFGMFMVVAGAIHLALNWRPLLAHLRLRGPRILGLVLAGVAALLIVAGLTHSVDPEVVEKIDRILSTARQAGRLD